MRDEDQPSPAERGDEHPFDELVADGPPVTPEEVVEFVSGYLLSIKTIAATQTNPLDAAQHALEATTRLIAGLSPAGSPGPVHLFGPLMEIVLTLQWGASLSETTIVKSAPRRGKGRPPTPPALLLGQTRAAAVMTMLMESGLSKEQAAGLVAGRLQRAGVGFDRANANPVNTVNHWRKEAMGHGPMRMAYDDALMRLRARLTPENAGSHQQILLKALDELAVLVE